MQREMVDWAAALHFVLGVGPSGTKCMTFKYMLKLEVFCYQIRKKCSDTRTLPQIPIFRSSPTNDLVDRTQVCLSIRPQKVFPISI